MLKITRLAIAMVLCLAEVAVSQNYRYVNTIFPAALKTTGVVYGTAPFLNSPYIDESNTTVRNLVMDIYQPQNDTLTKRPAIIFAHAGGFITGSRTVDDMVAFCDTFARKGYITATIDYRQGLEIFDNADLHYTRGAYRGLQDGRTAVRFLRANAATYGIDTGKVYLAGSSAGSFIALNSVFMDSNELPVYVGTVTYSAFLSTYSGPALGLPDIGANLSFRGTANGVMSCWGGVGDTLTIGSNNPTPVFLIHGTADQTVPFNAAPPFGYTGLSDVFGSNLINKRLTDIGIPAKETYFVSGQGHEFYGTNNGMWSNGTGGNAYWDTIVVKATGYFWQLHKPTAAFTYSVNGLSAEFSDQSQGALEWLWNFGDGSTGTNQNPVHSFANPGTYNVRLYITNSIKSWDTISAPITVSAVSGILKTDHQSVKLYPVPAKGFVTILSDHQINPANIEVNSFYGMRKPVRTTQTANGIILDLTGWEKGFYLICIHTDDGILYKKLVID